MCAWQPAARRGARPMKAFPIGTCQQTSKTINKRIGNGTLPAAFFFLAASIAYAQSSDDPKNRSQTRGQANPSLGVSGADVHLPTRSGVSPRLDQIQPDASPATAPLLRSEREKENLPVPLPQRKHPRS